MSDHAQGLVRRLFEAINDRAYDALPALVHPEYVHRTPGEEVRGVEGLRELLVAYHQGFPDLELVIEDIFGAGTGSQRSSRSRAPTPGADGRSGHGQARFHPRDHPQPGGGGTDRRGVRAPRPGDHVCAAGAGGGRGTRRDMTSTVDAVFGLAFLSQIVVLSLLWPRALARRLGGVAPAYISANRALAALGLVVLALLFTWSSSSPSGPRSWPSGSTSSCSSRPSRS